MSLNVPDALLEPAERGEIDEAAFVECVRTSLPYAWETITRLIGNLELSGGDFADDNTSPPDLLLGVAMGVHVGPWRDVVIGEGHAL